MYELLKKKHPNISSQTLNNQTLFQHLYGSQNYDDKKVRDRLSSLLKHAENYLAFSVLKRDQITIAEKAIKILEEKNLEKHLDAKIRELEKYLKQQNLETDDYLFHLHYAKYEAANYYINKQSLGGTSKLSHSMEDSTRFFVLFSIVRVLKHAVTMLNIAHHVAVNLDNKLFDWALEISNEKPFSDYPVIILLRGLIMLTSKHRDVSKNYYGLKKLLMECKDSLHREELRLIAIELYNYSKRRALEGDMKFRKENYAFMKTLIAMEAYSLEGKYMSESAYLTFASQAMSEGDFKWAEKFIDDCKEKLSPMRRGNAYTYILSLVDYYKKNYSNALKGFNRVKLADFYYQLRIKNYTSRIYFELGEYEQVFRVINAFRAYLSTNKIIPQYVKTRFSKYLSYLDRMTRAKTAKDEFKLKQLGKELRTENQAENKEWLMEQLTKV
jgi:hypothetical protein